MPPDESGPSADSEKQTWPARLRRFDPLVVASRYIPMAFRVPDQWGCVLLLAFLFVPGLVAAYFLNSPIWAIATPVALAILMLIVAALPSKRKITPQEWADDLEKHLLGTDGPYGWDDAVSVTLADERLENLRSRLYHDFGRLDTPEKREEFHQIIEALRRGEIP